MDESKFSDFVVYADESGDHSLVSIDAEYPIFVLSFCVFRKVDYASQVVPRLSELKFKTFGHDIVVLHENDIRNKRGPFSQMSREPREEFMGQLATIIKNAPMTLFAVIIDKRKLKSSYAQPSDPYNLGLKYGLERIYHFLEERSQHGRKTHIVFEARGKKEDRELELEFRRVCDGMNFKAKSFLFDAVFADKKCNSTGLQLADMMARPIGMSVLRPNQPNRAYEVLKEKFYAVNGKVRGWGIKMFP